jgi:hypothetical protein
MLTSQQELTNIRAISDHVAGGIIVPFNVVDKFKTWWNRDSDFALHLFKERPAFWFHLSESRKHEHNWQRAGTVLDDSFEVRDNGLYAQARIDDENMWQRILAGGIGWSTGTMPNLMRIRDDGYVQRWPIVELSAAPTEHLGSLPNTTNIEIIRVHLPDITQNEEIIRSNWIMSENGVTVANPPVAAPTIDPLQFQAMQQQMSGITDSLRLLTEAAQAPARQLPVAAPPTVEPPKPAPMRVGYHWDEASLFTGILRARLFPDIWEEDRQFRASVLEKIERAYSEQETQRISDSVLPDTDRFTRSFPIDDVAYNALKPRMGANLRANEAMATVDSGWTDLIDTLFESVAWHYFRRESAVMSVLPTHIMGASKERITVVTGGPVFNKVAEVEDSADINPSTSLIPSSKVTMDNIDFQTYKAGARTFASRELFEETKVSVAEAWAMEYLRAAKDAMDYTLINGDETDTDDNIGSWTTGGGTTAIPSAEASSTGKSKLLMLDGLRHMALVTDTNTLDFGGALASDDIVKLRRKLGTRGDMGMDISNLVIITDLEGFYEIELLADYKSQNDVGALATLVNGPMTVWRRVPVLAASAASYALTNATGQVPQAGGGTKFSMVCLWRPAIRLGIFRALNTKVAETLDGEARQIVSTWRIDLQRLQPDSVVLGFNGTVTA